MQHVDSGGSAIHPSALNHRIFSAPHQEPLARGCGMGTACQNAKASSVLPLALATAINQKRPTTISTLLTLHSHPTADTGSGPNDAEHVLLSCQVHLLPTPAGIRPLVWKKKKKKSEGGMKKCFADAPVSYCITARWLGTFTLHTSCVEGKARGTINPLII